MELVLLMYNVHPYFSLKNLGKKVHIIHGKIQYFLPTSYFWLLVVLHFQSHRSIFNFDFSLSFAALAQSVIQVFKCLSEDKIHI